MCGITGLYTFDPRPDRVQIHKIVQGMSDAITARGPDAGDVWQDPDEPIALGHRRLSIIDLSPMGAQPMESHSGRYMIAFNGEIYNFKDIRKDLEFAFSVKFRGNSDTEVLLSAIEHWGITKTLENIKGMFAFALWDRKAKALYFARDRFGKKPLYIGWAGSTLVFGSELKSITAHPDFRRDVNRGSLTSYMRFGYVPAPLCIYKQVWHLPAGKMMAVDMQMLMAGQDLTPLMEHYWNPKNALITARENPVTGDDDTVIKDFEKILYHSVGERMISDVPLGAFLSGGIDSSTIVALMQKHANESGGGKVKTYSIGFDEAGYNEAEHAKAIAAHLGTDHHERYVTAKDALDIVTKLPQIYDEPFADTSAIPTFMVSEFARESVTVALSGDGGDEMLGGYNRHITGPKAWKTVNGIPTNLRKPFAEIIKTLPPSFWNKMRPNRPQFGAHMHKFADILTKYCEGDVYLSLVSNWPKPKGIVKAGYEDVIPLVAPEMQVEGLGFAESMMYWDVISYLNGDILTKIDRASMAVGLEARAPLLDQRIYEYVWRLPMEMKIRNGQGKWLLRQVLQNHVPSELFNRPKQGFSVPIADWLRTDLRDWAEDLLDEKTLKDQGYLDYKKIRKTWDQHQKGRGSHANKLWTVLMFQSWHKNWNVS
ncbi:MAG: asparagine synthase (glutamine-hydrolyzing) [Alphaproteobacteria bacterium]